MPLLLLVRHGHSTANADGVLAGWTPGIALSDKGRDQVTRLGSRLAGIPLARVVTSPLQRTRETADAVLAARGGEPALVEDEQLGECHYGAWTGRPLRDLAKEPLWKTVQGHPSAATFPDGEEYAGESLAAMSARAVAAVRRHDAQVREAHGDKAIWVAVTHGDIIKAVLAEAAGTHLDLFQRFQADPASVSAIRYTAERPFVVLTNDTGGDLSGLVPAAEATGDAAVGGGAGAGGSSDADPGAQG